MKKSELETIIYAMIGLMIVVAIFAFIVFCVPTSPAISYAGSVGDNMSNYNCLYNDDACHAGNESDPFTSISDTHGIK